MSDDSWDWMQRKHSQLMLLVWWLPVTSLILFFLCCCVLPGLVNTTHKTQFKNSFSLISLLGQCKHAVISILLCTFGPGNHHSQNSVFKFYVKSVWCLERKPCCEVFSLMSSPSGANTLRRLLPFFFFFFFFLSLSLSLFSFFPFSMRHLNVFNGNPFHSGMDRLVRDCLA